MAEPRKAPASLEPRRRPNLKGVIRLGRQGGVRPELEVPLDLPPVLEPRVEVTPPESTQEKESTVEPTVEPEQFDLPPELALSQPTTTTNP